MTIKDIQKLLIDNEGQLGGVLKKVFSREVKVINGRQTTLQGGYFAINDDGEVKVSFFGREDLSQYQGQYITLAETGKAKLGVSEYNGKTQITVGDKIALIEGQTGPGGIPVEVREEPPQPAPKPDVTIPRQMAQSALSGRYVHVEELIALMTYIRSRFRKDDNETAESVQACVSTVFIACHREGLKAPVIGGVLSAPKPPEGGKGEEPEDKIPF